MSGKGFIQLAALVGVTAVAACGIELPNEVERASCSSSYPRCEVMLPDDPTVGQDTLLFSHRLPIAIPTPRDARTGKSGKALK